VLLTTYILGVGVQGGKGGLRGRDIKQLQEIFYIWKKQASCGISFARLNLSMDKAWEKD
jgi:hypothetical protein